MANWNLWGSAELCRPIKSSGDRNKRKDNILDDQSVLFPNFSWLRFLWTREKNFLIINQMTFNEVAHFTFKYSATRRWVLRLRIRKEFSLILDIVSKKKKFLSLSWACRYWIFNPSAVKLSRLRYKLRDLCSPTLAQFPVQNV